jgi:hypothetical protein
LAASGSEDAIDLAIDQLRSERRQQIVTPLRPAIDEGHILSFHETSLGKSFVE